MAVSVTRAMNVIDDYPDHDIRKYRGPFTEKDAQELLKKKLEDIAGEPQFEWAILCIIKILNIRLCKQQCDI